MASSDQEVVNITEKKLIIEMLELYKDFPCLWDLANELYCNKDARKQALEILLEKWKTGYPQATLEDVKKKIEHLRAGYRRERKKVESSKSTGAGSKDVYNPSLWYYPYLSFLHEKTMPTSQGIDNIPGTPESNSEEPATKREKISIKRQNAILYQKQEELIQSATQLIKESSSHEDTSADAFGRSVSSQLKELPKLQRCIVEKMIGELLFYAKLGELSINLNKNLHTGTQSYYTQPYTNYLYQQHSSPSIPSPQYSHPSPSPQYSHPSPSPQNSHPSPSPRHLQPLSSPHYLQHSSSLRQQLTPSLPQTPADTITIYSAKQPQYLPMGQVPDDFSETSTYYNDTISQVISSRKTQLNVPNTRASERNTEMTQTIVRGTVKELQEYLILKK